MLTILYTYDKIINVVNIWIKDLYGDIRIHKIIKLIVDINKNILYNKRVVRSQGGFKMIQVLVVRH